MRQGEKDMSSGGGGLFSELIKHLLCAIRISPVLSVLLPEHLTFAGLMSINASVSP